MNTADRQTERLTNKRLNYMRTTLTHFT